jgi:hypothetical protein
MTFREKVEKLDTTIIFEELGIPALLSLENNMKTSVGVRVYQRKRLIARYYKEFEHYFSEASFNIFIVSFLRSSMFRSRLQHVGEWQGNFRVASEEWVNESCIKSIQKINALENPSFQDFMRLKTFGKDSYSNKKKDELVPSLPIDDIRRIQNEFRRDIGGDHLMLAALRWLSRGISVEYAIKKVRVDAEVARVLSERYK